MDWIPFFLVWMFGFFCGGAVMVWVCAECKQQTRDEHDEGGI